MSAFNQLAAFSAALSGVPVKVTETAMVRTWVFPSWRFVTFEPKDERWCRRLGIGHEETRPGAYMLGGMLFCHPVVAEQLKKSLPRR